MSVLSLRFPTTTFRGKEIPWGHALILGLLQPTNPVIVYQDLSSVPTLNWAQADVDKAWKDGWITKLPPMLLVKVIERTENQSLSDLYEFKDVMQETTSFLKVEIVEGPSKGKVWWIRGIDTVKNAENEDEAETRRKYAKPWGTARKNPVEGLFQTLE